MTTKIEQFKEEADRKARFLIVDIRAALDLVPDEALPEVASHLEQALQAARNAMETKKREATTRGR
jgi:Sec-independent protein translocase protein TatA